MSAVGALFCRNSRPVRWRKSGEERTWHSRANLIRVPFAAGLMLIAALGGLSRKPRRVLIHPATGESKAALRFLGCLHRMWGLALLAERPCSRHLPRVFSFRKHHASFGKVLKNRAGALLLCCRSAPTGRLQARGGDYRQSVRTSDFLPPGAR